jgi:hypothetical protein
VRYYTIWLQWLLQQLADGFSIHHVDGNHANNAPENLVLIEDIDHMSLHGNGGLRPFNYKETIREGINRASLSWRPLLVRLSLGCAQHGLHET